MLPVGWLSKILRQDVNSIHCYQHVREQLEFGAGVTYCIASLKLDSPMECITLCSGSPMESPWPHLFSSQSIWNKFRIILKLKSLKFKTVILSQCQTPLYTVILNTSNVFSVTYHICLGKHACLCILDQVVGGKYFMLCTLWGLSPVWMDQNMAHQPCMGSAASARVLPQGWIVPAGVKVIVKHSADILVDLSGTIQINQL